MGVSAEVASWRQSSRDISVIYESQLLDASLEPSALWPEEQSRGMSPSHMPANPLGSSRPGRPEMTGGLRAQVRIRTFLQLVIFAAASTYACTRQSNNFSKDIGLEYCLECVRSVARSSVRADVFCLASK